MKEVFLQTKFVQNNNLCPNKNENNISSGSQIQPVKAKTEIIKYIQIELNKNELNYIREYKNLFIEARDKKLELPQNLIE